MDFITRTKPWFLPGESALQEGAPKKPTNFKGGSTASVALISTPTATPFWDPQTSATLVTAHIGDTRILLSSTSTGLALPLTTNHHPSSPTESRRLRRYATAFVSDSFGEERFGTLANTRSFGDVSQKRLGVSAEPEVYRRELEPSEYSFIVLMSDGISGVLTDQEVVDIVKECRTPDEGAKELVEFAEEVTTEADNTTAVVVRLGGWDQRAEGGEGFMGTKDLRAWRRDEALAGSRGRRM
ncbi:phosphatase 2C-like domain-containing protein [Tuber indicum]|nr:phosphatase 2C-like domain-containing protein [Tuber indicum]